MRCTCDEGFQHESQQHLHSQKSYGTGTVSAGEHGAVTNSQLRLQGEGKGSREAVDVLHTHHVPLWGRVMVLYSQVSVKVGQQVPQAGKQKPVGQEGDTEG